MIVYTLTPLGSNMARSVSSPQVPAWKIIHYLDKTQQATGDQIAANLGVSPREISPLLARLRRRGVIADVSSSGDRRW